MQRKKYEIATDEVGNPIKQDEKKGVLREFKKGDIFFNYGCLPVSILILHRHHFFLQLSSQSSLIYLSSVRGKIPLLFIQMQRAAVEIMILLMYVKLGQESLSQG